MIAIHRHNIVRSFPAPTSHKNKFTFNLYLICFNYITSVQKSQDRRWTGLSLFMRGFMVFIWDISI
jgi:hypothetical protein